MGAPTGGPPAPGPPAPTPMAMPTPTAVPDKPQPETPWFGPHNTVYINRLNEKVKIPELKKALFHVFSQFGGIREIFAEKRLALKGQAWIVFEKVESATKALSEMQGFNFYGNEMNVAYAKLKSDLISKEDGSFAPRPKRKPEKKKKIRKSKKDKKSKKKKVKKQAKPEPEDLDAPVKKEQPSEPQLEDEDDNEDEPMQGPSAPPMKEESTGPPAPKELPPAPPNRILFVENLPEQCNRLMLDLLFQQYPGYKESRLVPGKPGIAFVEFADQFLSSKAIQALQNFKITPQNRMKITFARQ